MATVVSGWRIATDRWVLLAVILTLSAAGAVTWAFYGRPRAVPTGEKAQKAVYFTRLVCPACEWERPYDSALEGQVCSNCNAGASLVGAQSPGAGGDGRVSAWSRGIAFGLIVTTILSGGALLARLRARAIRRAAADVRSHLAVARCPFCDGKVRYPVARAGASFDCARCKTTFILPALADQS